MDPEERTIEMEQGWDASASVDVWIENAQYAILATRLGVPEVMLVRGRSEKGERYTSVQLSGSGLHYDGDGSIRKDFLRQCIRAGKMKITTQWATCEKFLNAND